MIIDTLDNLGKYASLNPLFPEIIRYLTELELHQIPLGKTELQPNKLVINVVQANPKTAAEAKLETHNQMIDIQIPLSGTETMGYSPRTELPEADYDKIDDISFYSQPPLDYITIKPGMFVIFFPEDAHAPAITPSLLKKIIVKVRA